METIHVATWITNIVHQKKTTSIKTLRVSISIFCFQISQNIDGFRQFKQVTQNQYNLWCLKTTNQLQFKFVCTGVDARNVPFNNNNNNTNYYTYNPLFRWNKSAYIVSFEGFCWMEFNIVSLFAFRTCLMSLCQCKMRVQYC